MEAKKTILFIEGEPNSPNGDLRQGLTKLFSQKLKGKMPKMILGGGKLQTINKFKTNKLEGNLFLLLIDLDNPESDLEKDLTENNLVGDRLNVFYMVQEMESWFLSQTEVLDKFYGIDSNKKKVSDKLVKRKPSEIPNPDKVMVDITKSSEKGQYHKINHAIELLKRLDATKLEVDFADFKRLIERLR